MWALRFCCWILFSAPLARIASGEMTCETSADCQSRLGRGSECQNGQCTNPYHAGGCLRNSGRLGAVLPDTSVVPRLRVCHSDDPPHAAADGLCRIPDDFRYPEIRIRPPNWESAVFNAWVLQIVLNEIGNVPASIESSRTDLSLDFYHEHPSFGFPPGAVDWDGFRRSSTRGNCVNFLQEQQEQNQMQKQATATSGDDAVTEKPYESCMDVVPELWNSVFPNIIALHEEGHTENIQGLGALGTEAWYIPFHTFQHDPTLVTYLGLAGEQHRRKLAETFLRPTTWYTYCAEVSNTSCATPDGVAQRPPEGPEEEDRMYVEGLYTGHFRKTEDNDCDKWPLNCTGHIADWPCTWTSHVESQAYHLNIAVKSNGGEGRSGGYKSSQLAEIWDAAFATQSHVLIFYWVPSVVSHKYANTPFEMIKVALPPPTLECTKHRVGGHDRCTLSDNVTAIYGDPRGACDEEPHILATAVSTAVRRSSQDNNLPEALLSPGYDIVRSFRISELQMAEMLVGFIQGTSGNLGMDGRDAVCEWVINNLDKLEKLLPSTYPRTIRKSNRSFDNPFFDAAVVAVACIAVIATLLGRHAAMKLMKRGVISGYKAECVMLYLFGIFLVSAASLLLSSLTSDAVCIASEYLIQMGYVFILVPLTIDVQVACLPLSEQNSMETTGLTRKTVVGSILILAFLVSWTIVDPPQQLSFFDLDTEKNEDGKTVVIKSFYCASRNDGWDIASVGWQLVVLFVTSVQALQAGTITSGKEGRILVLLTYSHFVFAALRAVVFFVQDLLGFAEAMGFQSLLLALDVIATLKIYFIPKFFAQEIPVDNRHSFASTMSMLRESSVATGALLYSQSGSFLSSSGSFTSAPSSSQFLEPKGRQSSKVSSQLFTIEESNHSTQDNANKPAKLQDITIEKNCDEPDDSDKNLQDGKTKIQNTECEGAAIHDSEEHLMDSKCSSLNAEDTLITRDDIEEQHLESSFANEFIEKASGGDNFLTQQVSLSDDEGVVHSKSALANATALDSAGDYSVAQVLEVDSCKEQVVLPAGTQGKSGDVEQTCADV